MQLDEISNRNSCKNIFASHSHVPQENSAAITTKGDSEPLHNSAHLLLLLYKFSLFLLWSAKEPLSCSLIGIVFHMGEHGGVEEAGPGLWGSK